MSISERAAIGARMMPLFREEARKRKVAGVRSNLLVESPEGSNTHGINGNKDRNKGEAAKVVTGGRRAASDRSERPLRR